jgi:hypothetical protein
VCLPLALLSIQVDTTTAMELERPREPVEDNTATSNAIHDLGPAPTAPDFTAFRFSHTVAPPPQAVRQSRAIAPNDKGVSSSVQSPQLLPSIHDAASTVC